MGLKEERMYTLKNLRNMMKNHTGMLVLLVISMFVSFGVLFFGVGLYYQYSKNIEDGEIDSYAVGFSINDIITKKNNRKHMAPILRIQNKWRIRNL